MYKSSSPYIKELLKGGVNWNNYSQQTLERALREDKIIFVHIGNISNISRRNKALELFNNKEVADIINTNFIAIAIDSEDMDEAYLAGMDLLLINEQRISDYINIFSLPQGKPFTSFSSLNTDDFIGISGNILNSFKNRREKLENAADLLTRRLDYSGVIHKKEGAKKIGNRLLKGYIKSWASRYIEPSAESCRSPYTLRVRNYLFVLEYAHKYNIPEYLNKAAESLMHLYLSPMFDPIDGGIFTEAQGYSFTLPHYDKSLYTNAKAMQAYILAYKYTQKEEFLEAAHKIASFLQKVMKKGEKGYITYFTLKDNPDKSTYYKFSLENLKMNFPQNRVLLIAEALGMDTAKGEKIMQIISNSTKISDITDKEMEILRGIRRKRENEVILDKRVITCYNCIVASAFCELSSLYDDERKGGYMRVATTILENILNTREAGDIELHKHITSDNATDSVSDLYDYSLFLNAALKIYLESRDPKWEIIAKEYTEFIMKKFYNPNSGMFSKTEIKGEIPPMKRAPVMDYNTMNSNSVMGENMLLLHKITNKKEYVEILKQQLYNIEPELIGSGPFMSGWGLQLVHYLTDNTLFPSE